VKKNLLILSICCLILAACAEAPSPPAPTPVPPPVGSNKLPTDRGDYFAASGVCSTCHKEMVDSGGADVSLDSFWGATMMANSAVDPYWQASVRGEILSNPGYDAIIQDKCTTCHTPMARTTKSFHGEPGVLFDVGFLDPDNDLHTLAIDGISCTLCHQISSDLLGEADSFSGGYIIDQTKPVGERENFGPYDVTDESEILMKSASGYIPVQSSHIQTSEMCGNCHTLFTPTVDDNGEVAGLFPEQMTYIEWVASSYTDDTSCQDCHMPEADGEVVLSVTGTPGRNQFSIHSFAGGNSYALDLLGAFGDDIGTVASEDQIKAAFGRAENQLQNNTAQILIENAQVEDNTLKVDLSVDSQVGHKLPSGFPSRRVWVHLVVKDEGGTVVFESGNWDQTGKILGNDNDLDDTAYEPHYLTIDSPDQVQIYEAIMGDVNEQVTTTLLRGAVYLKDNRLLPAGFDKTTVSEDIAVSGAAFGDPDFLEGHDSITYNIPLPSVSGSYSVSVDLLYQSIGNRWALNLDRFNAAEPQRFISYYSVVPNLPVVISTTSVDVTE